LGTNYVCRHVEVPLAMTKNTKRYQIARVIIFSVLIHMMNVQ